MTCRTCKWLEVPPRRDGKIVPRRNNSYRCAVPVPPPPAMPASIRITARHSYGLGNLEWPTSCGDMEPDDGVGCTFHAPRKP